MFLSKLFRPAVPSEKYIYWRNGQRFELGFASVRTHGPSLGDSTGCTYRLGSRECTDIASFRKEITEEITGSVRIRRDAFGCKVLEQASDVPTFDYHDCLWDGYRVELLVFDGQRICLIDSHSGYRMAPLRLYEGLMEAPVHLKPWLKKLGFPTRGIRWIKVK